MKKSVTPNSDYLKSLETKERASKRRKFFILGALGAVAVSSAFFVPKILASGAPNSSTNLNFQSYFATELTDDKIRAFFTGGDGNDRIVINYPGEDRRDTIASYDEYSAIVSRRSDWDFSVVATSDMQFEEGQEGGEMLNNEDADNSSPVDDALQAALGNAPIESAVDNTTADADATKEFGFRIRGERVVGSELSLQVVNWEEGTTFEMDFGDGVRKEIKRNETYSFAKPGVYTLIMRAFGENTPRKIYATYPITIEAPISENTSDETDSATATGDQPISLQNQATLDGPLEDEAPPEDTAVPTEKEAAPAAKANPNDSAENNKPFFYASKMPSFPGGRQAMYRFISKNIRYPNVTNQREGKVDVRFVVDEKGNISEPSIIKGLGGAYDKEVMRILSIMPKWSSGEQNGKKVPVYQQLRVSFDLID